MPVKPQRKPEPVPDVPFSLSDLVDEHIQYTAHPDPHVISQGVAQNVPNHELRGVIERLLPDYVGERLRSNRSKAVKAVRRGKSTSKKWAKARKDHQDGIAALLRQPFWVPEDGWKYLGDLNYEQCQAVAGEYTKRAEENMAYATAFATVARLLKEQRVEIVEELDADTIGEAFET